MVCRLKIVVEQDSVESLNDNRWHLEQEGTLSSPDWADILLPRSFKNWQAVSLSGPSDSTAIGWKIHLSFTPDYLAILSSAARSAAAQASFAVAATHELAIVHTAVTSQTRGLPPFQGTSVRLSGRLPSDRNKPCGSLSRDTGRGKGRSNQIILCVVHCYFSWSLSTHEAVKTMCVNQRPTVAVVRHTDGHTQPHTDCNPHCLVV